jgi:hypothetical protein
MGQEIPDLLGQAHIANADLGVNHNLDGTNHTPEVSGNTTLSLGSERSTLGYGLIPSMSNESQPSLMYGSVIKKAPGHSV